MKDVILSIYLSIYLSVCLFVCPFVRLSYPQHPPLSLPYTASILIEIGPKQLGAEMTQGWNYSPT